MRKKDRKDGCGLEVRSFAKNSAQSMITEKKAAVHFPGNTFWSEIFKKANGCLEWRQEAKFLIIR